MAPQSWPFFFFVPAFKGNEEGVRNKSYPLLLHVGGLANISSLSISVQAQVLKDSPPKLGQSVIPLVEADSSFRFRLQKATSH